MGRPMFDGCDWHLEGFPDACTRGNWIRVGLIVSFVFAQILLSQQSTYAQQGSVIRPLPQPLENLTGKRQTQQSDEAAGQPKSEGGNLVLDTVNDALSPQGLPSTMKIMLLLTLLSLAPSILIMTTCFIRFVIVLGLLRQALGTQQLPPNQVIIALCLFLTFMVMAPVWQQSYEQGIAPYTMGRPIPGLLPGEEPFKRVLQNTLQPLRRFMSEQIYKTGNEDGIWMLLEYQRPNPDSEAGQSDRDPENFNEVPFSVLLPAFMLSELKTAFIIGFQIYLPFVVIDMVISSILISMGMMMLPPVLISLPFKLLLFVLINGWFLTVGMMLQSVQSTYG